MPKLTDNTMVVHPETREAVLLAATGDLPDWAEGLVGPHLLEEGGQPVAEDNEVARLKARIAELEAAKADAGSDPDRSADQADHAAAEQPRRTSRSTK